VITTFVFAAALVAAGFFAGRIQECGIAALQEG
jgi:hypothetical protein